MAKLQIVIFVFKFCFFKSQYQVLRKCLVYTLARYNNKMQIRKTCMYPAINSLMYFLYVPVPLLPLTSLGSPNTIQSGFLPLICSSSNLAFTVQAEWSFWVENADKVTSLISFMGSPELSDSYNVASFIKQTSASVSGPPSPLPANSVAAIIHHNESNTSPGRTSVPPTATTAPSHDDLAPPTPDIHGWSVLPLCSQHWYIAPPHLYTILDFHPKSPPWGWLFGVRNHLFSSFPWILSQMSKTMN